MNSRKALSLLAIMVLVCAAIFWFLRQDRAVLLMADSPSTSTSPSSDATMSANPESVRIAEQGAATTAPRSSLQASASTFSKSQACYFASRHADVLLEAIAACEAMAGVKEVDATYQKCHAERPELQARLDQLELTRKGCVGTSAEAGSAYYAATKTAAAQGNLDAQVCYVQSAFGADAVYTDEDVRDYLRDAPKYAQAGLARGDWRIVAILGTTRFTPASGLLPRLVKGDVMTRYQMNRLARLGASGEYAIQLDREAQAEFPAASHSGLDVLSLEQREEAERKAREVYKNYFSRSPPLAERPIPCKGP